MMEDYLIKKDQLFTKKITEIISQLPKDIFNLWVIGNIILVGGAIRSYFENKEPRDLDFFCFEQKIFDMCNNILLSSGFVVAIKKIDFCKYKKDNLEVDIILFHNSKNIIGILETSDFTISKAGYYKGCLVVHNCFDEDLRDKKLVYCGSYDPKASWVRQSVFREEGYTIDEINLHLLERDIDNQRQN